MKLCGTLVLMLAVSCLVLLPGCADDPEQPRTGTVSAVVLDGSHSPVAEVEIRLSPTSLVAKTDENGLVVFEVPPGSYFVDANVCCAGPGFIDYHLPVVVRVGRTVAVELRACLVCL